MRAVKVLRVAALCFAAWVALAWLVAEALIVRGGETKQADAIVVLAGSSAYAERTRWAVKLYGENLAPKIILTNDNTRGGWSNEQRRNPFFFERAEEELRRAGVPADRIEVIPQVVSSTYEEAVVIREYATAHNLRSVLVVTSGYHSRRALWTMRRVFRESGIKVDVNAAPRSEQTPSPAKWWLSTRGWLIVAGEYPKFVYYWLRYR